jgi:hypothetical protein
MALGLGINLSQVYFQRGNYKYFSQYVLLIEAGYIDQPIFDQMGVNIYFLLWSG